MLHFKITKREVKQFGKEKKTVHLAERVARGTLGLKQVEEMIVQKTSLARGDVRNAIISLAEVVNHALLSGLRVDLGELGSLSVEAGVKMQERAQDVTASTIKKPQIRYTPKHEMRRNAQRIAISIDRDGIAPSATATHNNSPASGAEGGSTSPSTGVNDSEL